MAVWVWVTLAAAAAQTIRGAGQRGLKKSKLGDFGAADLIRFSYAIPFAWAWIYLYGAFAGQSIPLWNQPFYFG